MTHTLHSPDQRPLSTCSMDCRLHVVSTDLQNVVITQLKLRVSRLLSPGPDRLTSTNQAMKYSPGQEVRKCETGRDKQGVMRDNKSLAYSEKLDRVSNLCCLLLMEAPSYF